MATRFTVIVSAAASALNAQMIQSRRNCHCRDCQRASGSAYAAALLAPDGALSITGEVKYYDVTGDSGGIVQRGFFPTCGARLFGKPAAGTGIISIMVGSLDDPSWYRPQADVYTASA